MTQPPFSFGFGPGTGPSNGGSGGQGNGFGFTPGGADDPMAAFAQMARLLSTPTDGPVHWDLAAETADGALTAAGPDPAVTPSDRSKITDALRLADVWLDAATVFPSGIVGDAQALTRRQWLLATAPAWRQIVEPVAAKVVKATAGTMQAGLAGLTEALGSGVLPPELASMLPGGELPGGIDPAQLAAAAGPMAHMMNQVGALMFGSRLGQALGALATEVVGTTDVGLPLAKPGQAAMLPANIAAFGAGLERPADEIRLYLALREAAHVRLFAHVPWLSKHLTDAVTAYAQGIDVDAEALGRAVQGMDVSDPTAVQRALEEGLFTPQATAEQQVALERLEIALALVEGWVDEVVTLAATPNLPGAEALRETVRRRRASGGPAEQTFGALVGLELRPRSLREASALWEMLREKRGLAGRDAVWQSPDLLPTNADLAEPARYVDPGAPSELDDPLAALARLEAEGNTGPAEPDVP